MANEQELLSDEAIYLDVISSIRPGLWSAELLVAMRQVAKAQVAKLKAIGYEQVWEKCPECKGKGKKYRIIPDKMPWFDGHTEVYDCPTCKGTGRITKYKSPEEIKEINDDWRYLVARADAKSRYCKKHHVEWDRDIIFSHLRNYGMAQISPYKDGKYYIPDDDAEDIVDQLKEELTGGRDAA